MKEWARRRKKKRKKGSKKKQIDEIKHKRKKNQIKTNKRNNTAI